MLMIAVVYLRFLELVYRKSLVTSWYTLFLGTPNWP
jgi:hypothetical protein